MITAMVTDIVENSLQDQVIAMSAEGEKTLLLFREFMFRAVYTAPALIPDRKRGYDVVRMLYQYYMAHPEEIPEINRKLGENIQQAAADFIAGLTDNHAISLFQDIFVPRYWNF
jgi:dGTPase